MDMRNMIWDIFRNPRHMGFDMPDREGPIFYSSPLSQWFTPHPPPPTPRLICSSHFLHVSENVSVWRLREPQAPCRCRLDRAMDVCRRRGEGAGRDDHRELALINTLAFPDLCKWPRGAMQSYTHIHTAVGTVRSRWLLELREHDRLCIKM